MRIPLICFIAAVAVGEAAFGALAGGDPVNGKTLAERWCASCHLVSPEQPVTTTEAPPFESLAARSPEALQAFLFNPHPPMPQLYLTRQEIRDLAAYIASLK